MQLTLQRILLVTSFLFVFSSVKAASADDILKQITALQAQIAQLQTQFKSVSFIFTKDLKQADQNDDVFYLQRVLRTEGLYCKKCYVTGYFGIGTKNALVAFQRKYGLDATGVVDSATRAKLNQVLPQTIPSPIVRQIVPVAPTPVPVPAPVPAPAPQRSYPAASLDTTSPSASISINGGVQNTTNPIVLLSLACQDSGGVDSVRYSNVSVFTQEQFVGFDPGKQWQLSSGDGVKTVYYQCKDRAGNVTTTSASITLDSTPPIRLNAQPSGILPAGTRQVTLSLQTNEQAACRYSALLGIDYDAMRNEDALSQNLTTSHSIVVGQQLDGKFSYAVRCKDALGNKNSDDLVVSFTVGTLNNTSFAMNVLVIKYFPLTSDKLNIDITITGDVGDLYTAIWQKTIDITSNLKDALQKASIYLGYKNSSAQPSLRYTIVDIKKYEEAVPTKNTPVLRYPDYSQVLNRESICNYVDKQNVQEVWLFAYQGPNKADGAPFLNIAESKMAGPFGDISNSSGYNDMPLCGKTYRVYTFNYGRGTAEALESWGHQIEAELDAVNKNLFRSIFQGPNYPQALRSLGRCGSVHNPPNARNEYDRANTISQESDCLDWKPDSIGALSQISCQNWGCDPLNYQVWNWQNLPGANNTKTYLAKQLRNWWDVHGDFDNLMANSKRLTTQP